MSPVAATYEALLARLEAVPEYASEKHLGFVSAEVARFYALLKKHGYKPKDFARARLYPLGVWKRYRSIVERSPAGRERARAREARYRNSEKGQALRQSAAYKKRHAERERVRVAKRFLNRHVARLHAARHQGNAELLAKLEAQARERLEVIRLVTGEDRFHYYFDYVAKAYSEQAEAVLAQVAS